MWTCRQLLEKRGELTMLKYFCKNSPKVSALEDFVNCRTAMPLITTTCGFVNAVSCWTTWMSFYRREHSVLLTPFLRLPLVSEYGIEDRSKLSTSFRQIGWDEELDKQVLVDINSNYYPAYPAYCWIWLQPCLHCWTLDLDVWNWLRETLTGKENIKPCGI